MFAFCADVPSGTSSKVTSIVYSAVPCVTLPPDSRQRPQPEPMSEHVAEEGLRRRHRKDVHDQDEIPGSLGAGKRVEVGDVHRRVAHHRRAAEMV